MSQWPAAIARPSVGDAVRIVVDDEPTEAFADEIAETHLDLLAADSAVPARIRRNGASAVLVEYVAAEDVWRLIGDLACHRQEAAGTILRFTYSSSAQKLLRREFVRADISAGVRLWLPDGERIETRTLDVSGGGIRVRGTIKASGEDGIKLVLALSGRPAIRATAQVVRETDEGDTGLRFTKISDDDRTALMLAVFDAQRRARG
jgi:hypothetical protein